MAKRRQTLTSLGLFCRPVVTRRKAVGVVVAIADGGGCDESDERVCLVLFHTDLESALGTLYISMILDINNRSVGLMVNGTYVLMP